MTYTKALILFCLQLFVQNTFSQQNNYGTYNGFSNMGTYGSYSPLTTLGLAPSTSGVTYTGANLAPNSASYPMYTDGSLSMPMDANLALISSDSLVPTNAGLALISSDNIPTVNLVSPVAELQAYGGSGVGDIVVSGDMPVGGTTLVAGQVPIMGSVRFTGDVAASGVISLSGKCGCGAPNSGLIN